MALRVETLLPLGKVDPAHPGIPIHLAAVNPRMCAVAGEVADGIRPHPVCTPSYVREVTVPAVRRSAERAGRGKREGPLPDDVRIAMKPLAATARPEEELPALVDDETLERSAAIGAHDVVADRLRERWDGVVTDVEFSAAVTDDADRATLADIARRLPARGGSDGRGQDGAVRARWAATRVRVPQY